ncbi:alanine racemase [Thermoanaerobacter brockii subsp. lactiethylicus]|jgi:alanine racemase|uniref:Alanine racemase n=2 Tax=Thermoanaerobacter TaxID=1754 RepID=B0KD55_THEP3|nr:MULTISPECIES: alanine racemase [Thermoanaerobacter]ABY92265.1 alanine racemase [Thermoanaerobacter sp. X514]ABY94153.1 alanine racemase [Thermoanaerobacter pseudethanolicus ATCC 33223]ADV79106.1 alanine racemase [Thermoanaerobacter brockii subsp. finnii Ako-1]MDI3501014.1 alanine racemase [Thermoanaerobacter sp.]MDI3529487.1 alanine racemase [Thermoanaerobacter sp.]
MFDNIRPTRAEIYLDNIVHNLSEVKRWVGKKVKIMGVVKANAYGHGACQVAKVLIENGVSYLGVATIEEALELRECGINIPILVFGYTPLPQAKELIVHNITQTVFDINYVKDLERIALNVGKKAKVHVKVDTGMGRIGYTDLNVAEKEIEKMMEMEGVEVEGIFSHFATSDEKDKTYAEQQFDMFKKLLESLKQKEINIPLKHIANSGAIIDLKYTYLDMVRPGIVLYGSYPSENVERPLDLRQTMGFKTKIVYIKEVPEGTSISYGRTFITKRKSKIATLPVGYADGFNRLLSNNHHVLVKGKYAPVIGRICMDQTMLDVTDIEGVEVGDDVTIFGNQDGEKITAEEIAKKLNTIPYEVYCGISRRVPRIYIYKGEVIEVKNYLKI